jgi:hypothetical protein
MQIRRAKAADEEALASIRRRAILALNGAWPLRKDLAAMGPNPPQPTGPAGG